jgi:hypothetical protein
MNERVFAAFHTLLLADRALLQGPSRRIRASATLGRERAADYTK